MKFFLLSRPPWVKWQAASVWTGFVMLWVLILLVLPGKEALGADMASGGVGSSRWSTHKSDNTWWLLTPEGKRFFSIGVNVVTGGSDERHFRGRIWYSWASFYPSFQMWLLATRVRLREWGFNTAGAWSLHPQELRLPTTIELDLGRLSRFHWFDPFDPGTQERMRKMARELVAPYKGNPYRIGYFSDNEVGWWNGPLFVYYIQKPASNKTKRKLVELLKEHYQGNWSLFLKDFQVPVGLDSFEDLVRTGGTDVLMRPGGNGIQVVRRWSGIISSLYYRLAWEALKEADPEALVLGDRLPIYYDPQAVKAMIPHVDVISVNYNVDSPDGWLAPYFFDGLADLAPSRPILISEWFFASKENRTGNRNLGHLMTVETQKQRAIGAREAAKAFASLPQVVGIHWFQYWDHPKGGRLDGEDYNFGLVDIYDRPYEELVEEFKKVNPSLEKIHACSGFRQRTRPDSGTIRIPMAWINVRDKHLGEWPKPEALLPRLKSSFPDIPFGEFYMAWDHQALYLAMIAMDYQDPELLAFEGEFPPGEAFRVYWGLKVGASARRFQILVVPPPREEDLGGDTYRMNVRFCRWDESQECSWVPGAVATYFGSDQPRIVLELSLPWEALGQNGPPSGQALSTELAVSGFYRARWMSLSGLRPEQAMESPDAWTKVELIRYGEKGEAPFQVSAGEVIPRHVQALTPKLL